MEDVEGAEEELSHEQRKEEEQAVIQKKIDETEAQIEKLEKMETGAGLNDMTLEELEDAGIHITNVMEFSATIELSAPKDLAKMYNFVSEKFK